MTKRTALVVAPGRGTYNKGELGYLHKHHRDEPELFASFDHERRLQKQCSILELDGSKRYSTSLFSRGDNASGLIYACAYGDYLSIDSEAFEVVAITGNSMGWYIALACASALSAEDGFRLANTMGTLMHDARIGGQLLYPFVDDNWLEVPDKKEALVALTQEIKDLYLSIWLGGMLVLGGSETAIAEAERQLDSTVDRRFPMRLANHSAFHTRLQAPVSEKGKNALKRGMFHQPNRPLIDGRGHIWYPGSSDVSALYDYTLEHQVLEPYDFTAAIQNGVREFAPDVIIILGPGSTLGGAVAQALIQADWRELKSKNCFTKRQSRDPLVLSLGLETQRAEVVRTKS